HVTGVQTCALPILNIREPPIRHAFVLTTTCSSSASVPSRIASNARYAVISFVRLAGARLVSGSRSASTAPVRWSTRIYDAAGTAGGAGTAISAARHSPATSIRRIDRLRTPRPAAVREGRRYGPTTSLGSETPDRRKPSLARSYSATS